MGSLPVLVIVGIMAIGIALSGRIAQSMADGGISLFGGLVRDPSPRLLRGFMVVIGSTVIVLAVASVVFGD